MVQALISEHVVGSDQCVLHMANYVPPSKLMDLFEAQEWKALMKCEVIGIFDFQDREVKFMVSDYIVWDDVIRFLGINNIIPIKF